jgi:hypothetical protein
MILPTKALCHQRKNLRLALSGNLAAHIILVILPSLEAS